MTDTNPTPAPGGMPGEEAAFLNYIAGRLSRVSARDERSNIKQLRRIAATLLPRPSEAGETIEEIASEITEGVHNFVGVDDDTLRALPGAEFYVATSELQAFIRKILARALSPAAADGGEWNAALDAAAQAVHDKLLFARLDRKDGKSPQFTYAGDAVNPIIALKRPPLPAVPQEDEGKEEG